MKRKVIATLLMSTLMLASLVPTAFAASDCSNTTASNIDDLLQKICTESGSIDCSNPSAFVGDLISNCSGNQSILQQLQDCQPNSINSASDLQAMLNQAMNTVAAAKSGTCPTTPSVADIENLAKQFVPTSTCNSIPAPTVTPAATEQNVSEATATPQATKAPQATSTPATTTTPASTTAPASNDVSYASSLEKEMVAMVNQERVAAGLPALIIDEELTANARAHSADMAQNNYFSHTSPTYGTFSERLKASGLSYISAGENIARYNDVAKAHVGLMNSEGHRANIMNSNFIHIGIGIVWDDDMNAYCITQWFASLR